MSGIRIVTVLFTLLTVENDYLTCHKNKINFARLHPQLYIQLCLQDTEIKDSDLQKFSTLHENLLKMKEETEEKRKSSKRELKARQVEKEKADKESEDRMTVDEFFEEETDVEEEEYSENDTDPGKLQLFKWDLNF